MRDLCALGPRVPGTKSHAAALAFLVKHARAHADRVELEEFRAAQPPYPPGVTLTNVVARFGPGRTPRILLGAHWDSRPRADADPDSSRRRQPVLGANDAASACAVLLHLAERFHAQPPAVGVDLVWFDGEDGGLPGTTDTYCLGSREHVRRLAEPRPAYAIVVDMVGDRNLVLPMESYSLAHAPEVVHAVWGRAEELGFGAIFVAEPQPAVFDDHVPFLESGIPAIDMIDFDYPYWHTVEDTPDKCSPQSLAVVGEVLASLAYSP
jgi:Zn-dependent M28 family amino/carboxypeptidase